MSGSTRILLPGLLAGLILAATLGAAGTGLLMAGDGPALGAALTSPYVLAVLRFSLLQAALSAVLSVALAIPVARALARRTAFPGRYLLLRLLGLPMVLPTIVAVLGIVAIYGRNGLVNRSLAWVGLPGGIDLYGLQGILIAHVFLNMPFAVRVLLQGWASIPGESFRLAAQLGMRGGQIFRWLEWPMIREVAPGIAVLVFLLCFSSFAVVLVLGGGPPNATLQVAIYQALKIDFDIPTTLALSLLQIVVAGGLGLAGFRLARSLPAEAGLGRPAERRDGGRLLVRGTDAFFILLASLIVLLPLGAVAWQGAAAPLPGILVDRQLWLAVARTLLIGLSAGTIALLMGSGFVQASRALAIRLRHPALGRAASMFSALVLVIPPFVIGAGLFVLARRTPDPAALAIPLVILINTLMALPFVVRILEPAATAVEARYGALAENIGMGAWHRLRLVDWPLLRRPAGLAIAVAATLSMGDFGVIALFGARDTQTLSLLLYQLMGSYRMGDAAVAALLLVVLCLAGFAALERGVGGRAAD